MTAALDHITVAALSLEQGVAHVRNCLGVDVPPGGAHPLMGTHNCLMRIGDGVFLEIIAPDPAAVPQRTRWFALDDPAMRARLERSPQLTCWVVRVPDLRGALRDIDAAVGEAVPVTRGSLSWLIAVPPDGSMPFGGAFPTLIEWPENRSPAAGMADLGCRLQQLSIAHPDSAPLEKALAPIIQDGRISVTGGAGVRLCALLDTPHGQRELT